MGDSGQVDGAGAAALALESLTPSFDEAQHGTYLRRLEEAVADPRNRNIALTGRYGAGKSSVLDKFEANHAESTLRLAISTLAPGEEGETTTNRIQKEVVKQLLYGANEKVGRNSRFTKIAVLTRRRAVAQAAAMVLCLGGLLYLLGWLPTIKWTGDGHRMWVRVAAWAGAAVLATVVVTVVRMLTYGRRVSDVSAGPAALTLDDGPDSYFDKFLDEIVHYFGRESKDIVLFEDLDRFEDPGIFEALRELNLLLNETPDRRRRRYGSPLGQRLRSWLDRKPQGWRCKVAAKLPDRWTARLFGTGYPLRFVYALRDSVFEKIDARTAAAATGTEKVVDAAEAETLRANRTKFFDIVISLVPFISHRNARDLLDKLLAQRGITGIAPGLVNTIAKYCTDMRLMRNVCNEYLVFAERLLEPEAPNKPAPGMDATHLFALVAYKNFHPADFENITRRDSDLDRLYELYQRLVRDTIAAKDKQKRKLLAEPERSLTQAATAEMLGTRLSTYAELLNRVHGSLAGFRVGSKTFHDADLRGYELWEAVAQNKALEILKSGYSPVMKAFDENEIGVFFPEALDAARWGEYDQAAVQAELERVERDIEVLRRAGYAELVELTRFTVAPGAAAGSEGSTPRTFAQLLQTTLKSDLARDLVRRGYIDRNFSLYAAQFYGNFTGVDVANFMVQHVQTNTMAIDYDLSRPGAVTNLLDETKEAGDELEHTVAAFNLDIINYLLATDDPLVDAVVTNLLASGPDEDGRAFLAAYFTADNTERVKLAAFLAKHGWPELFTYLVSSDDVPVTARPALVNAALCAYDPDAAYELDDAVRDFITANYPTMGAFVDQHPVDATVPLGDRIPERVHRMLTRASVVIPNLAEVLDDRLRDLIVEGNRYQLTADNLRSALGITGEVSLDQAQANQSVYKRCLAYISDYIVAIDNDPETDHTIVTPATLASVLNDGVETWDDALLTDPEHGVVAHLLNLAAPDSRLNSLSAAPEVTWPALAAAGLFRSSLANVETYRARVGSIDNHLATLLKRAGTIHVDGPGDTTNTDGNEYNRQTAAVAILNAPMLAPADRVDLAASLRASLPLPVEDIDPATSILFALLLERDMVEADETSFEHFHAGGWASIGPALKVCADIETVLKPHFVYGMVSDMLGDTEVADKVGQLVLDDVEEYVPNDDWRELKAVARYADVRRAQLPPDSVTRIARVADENGDVEKSLLLRLLASAAPSASAEHIITVFELLGPDYNKIQQTGEKLKFDRDGTHEELLKVLKAAGLITRGTGLTHYSAIVR